MLIRFGCLQIFLYDRARRAQRVSRIFDGKPCLSASRGGFFRWKHAYIKLGVSLGAILIAFYGGRTSPLPYEVTHYAGSNSLQKIMLPVQLTTSRIGS